MSLDLITITADNIRWAVNENWRRVFEELQYKCPTDGRVRLEGDWDFGNLYQLTGIVSSGPGSAVPTDEVADTYFNQVIFLCHADTYPFVDSSSYARTVTTPVTKTLSALSKFGDGSINSTDAATAANTAVKVTPGDYTFNLEAIDFTIEFWMRVPTPYVLGARRGAVHTYTDSGMTSAGFGVSTQSGGATNDYFTRFGYSSTSFVGDTRVPDGVWRHIALSRTGTRIDGYVDGALIGTATSAPVATEYHPALCLAGVATGSTSQNFSGQIDEVRITAGVGRYPNGTPFTPPTERFSHKAQPTDPWASSVQLLLHADGANGSTTFTDAKGHTITRDGAEIVLDTSQFKYGTASIRPGTSVASGQGKRIRTAVSSDFACLNTNFTLECWVRPEVVSGFSGTRRIASLANSSNQERYGIGFNTSGQLCFLRNGTPLITSSALTAGTWYHVALVRSGTVVLLLVNGVRVSAGTTVADATGDCSIHIGDIPSGDTPLNQQHFPGWIDEVRFTKGVARYYATHTITGPFV